MIKLGLIGIVLILFVTYGPLSRAGFIYEDEEYLKTARQGLTVATLAQPRGLTHVTFRANYLMAGEQPAAYHLTNLVLHVTNARLLYAVSLRLVSPGWALLPMALYTLHPIQSEMVSYLAGGRAELLMILGTLLTIWAVTGARRRPAVALLGMVVAVGGKELGVLALPLAGLWLWTTQPAVAWRRRWVIAAALGVLALGSVALAIRVLGNAYLAAAERGPFVYLCLQTTAFWRLIALTIWPVGFTIDPDVEALAKGPQIALVALSAIGLAGALRCRATRLGAAWMALTLLPRLIVRIPEYLNEHQAPLILLGWWWTLTAGLQALWQHWAPVPEEDSCPAVSS